MKQYWEIIEKRRDCKTIGVNVKQLGFATVIGQPTNKENRNQCLHYLNLISKILVIIKME